MSSPKKETGRPGHGGAAPKNGPSRPLAGIPIPGLSGITERPRSLPFYGNYCGRGHGDPTYRTPPVDAVDAACREHNRCYELLGDYDEGCDRNFAEILPAAIAETPSQAGKNAGLLALAYFSLAEPNLGLGRTLFGGASPWGGEGTKTRGGDTVSEGTRAQGPQGGRSGEATSEATPIATATRTRSRKTRAPRVPSRPCSTWTYSPLPAATRPPWSPVIPTTSKIRQEMTREKGVGSASRVAGKVRGA